MKLELQMRVRCMLGAQRDIAACVARNQDRDSGQVRAILGYPTRDCPSRFVRKFQICLAGT
jgi:hypothetical protein